MPVPSAAARRGRRAGGASLAARRGARRRRRGRRRGRGSFRRLFVSRRRPAAADYKGDVAQERAGAAEEGGRGSRPLSAELGGYGAALEDVLAWLLEAEERLAAQPPLRAPAGADAAPARLHDLKEHFHTHEVSPPRRRRRPRR